MNTRPPRQVLHYRRQHAETADRSPQDEELIERFVAAHDGTAFARLMERHGPMVLGVCRRVLRNHHDAEDVFQATFLALARKAQHIRQRKALAGWLHRVAYRLSVRHRASSRQRQQADLQALPAQPRPAEDQVVWSELHHALDEELDRLPEKYRAPLLLCCLAGRTREQAAELMGWTLGTIKMRLERGRQLLRSRLALRGIVIAAALLAMLTGYHPVDKLVHRPEVLTTAGARDRQ